MNRFENTKLWQKTLSTQLAPDQYEKERTLLRSAFEEFRDRAKTIAEYIQETLPNYTIHNISHIDGLWEMAELVTDGDYELTPTEAFVLGGAFLIHDLGMGLAAYPEGIDNVKKSVSWKDITASFLRKENKEINDENLSNPGLDIEKKVLEVVLRNLHAEKAKHLAEIYWQKDGNRYYLIENSDLRESYANIIGLIAYSHWWQVSDLEEQFSTILGAPSKLPPNWTVDPLRLACLLRISDAIQIDDRRAPSFLRAIKKVDSYSDLHWIFQQKLYQPRLERERIVYTSKSNFSVNESESWWLCHDTLKMIDQELHNVDSLLADTNRKRLKATGVASIEHPSRLTRLIRAEGWLPVNTEIKVGNVAKLVKTLGGEELYGDNPFIAIRELIQNACDAVRARRLLEDENDNWGSITIRSGADVDGNYLEIEDNGVGMSTDTLLGPFLDFGQSFWGSALMHKELPGLEAKSYKSTGKYGIGFFSVFMLGNRVTVTTKKYDQGRDATQVLEFKSGVIDRPLLRKAKPDEYVKDGGTRIRVWYSDKIKLEDDIYINSELTFPVSVETRLSSICACIDVDLYYCSGNDKKKIVEANSWITIDPIMLLKRIFMPALYDSYDNHLGGELSLMAENMRVLTGSNNVIYGRAFVYYPTDKHLYHDQVIGAVYVGGFLSTRLTGICGVLTGYTVNASRNLSYPQAHGNILNFWRDEQEKLLEKSAILDGTKSRSVQHLRALGSDNIYELKFIKRKNSLISYKEFVNLIKSRNMKEVLLVSEYAFIQMYAIVTDEIELFDNVFSTTTGIPSLFFNADASNKSWPPFIKMDKYKDSPKPYWYQRSVEGLFYSALSEAWNIDLTALLNYADSIKSTKSSVVGKLGDKDISTDLCRVLKVSDLT